MKLDSQRIAIAEACGWDNDDIERGHTLSQFSEYVPDYLNDLNAMHEAEATLDGNQQVAFGCNLARLGTCYKCMPGNEKLYVNWKASHATAAQRAEAFLRTIGKWEGAK